MHTSSNITDICKIKYYCPFVHSQNVYLLDFHKKITRIFLPNRKGS